MKKLIVSTTKYVVAEDDTVEKIAARCDCTPSQLLKLNKLPSRVLFSGQTIFVPDGTTVEEDASSTASETTPEPAKVHVAPEVPSSVESVALEELAAELDAECVQKFLKLNTHQVTKHDGDIPGVLIITPNCVMFDPDPRDPAVLAGGPDMYGVVAPIDAVVLVGLYENSPHLPTTSSSNENVSDPSMIRTYDTEESDVCERPVSAKIAIETRNRTISEDYYASVENDDLDSLPEVVITPEDPNVIKRRASTSASLTSLQLKHLSSLSPPKEQQQQRRSSFSFPFHFRDSKSSTSPVRKLSGMFKRHDKTSNDSDEQQPFSSPGKRKLSAGNKDTQEGDSHMEFNDGWYPACDEQLDDELVKQKQNFDALQRLKIKTEDLRKKMYFLIPNTKGFNGSLREDSGLMQMEPHPSDTSKFYLRICLDERRRKKEITKNAGLYDFGDKTRNEFLFLVPAEKIEVLYALFLQWASEKNEHETISGANRSDISAVPSEASEKSELGFVFVDDLSQNSRLESEFHSFAAGLHEANVKFKWEIVSMHEMKRRLSLLEITELSFLALPDGTDQSKILTEPMIRRIVSFLPARAQAYPWMLIYSSDVHGFSLGTMYRNMFKWKDEMTPVLLVIKDSSQCVFGAVINCIFKVSEHFYGSGESVLFSVFPEFRVYRWTGVNNFIVKGNTDSLAIGSGHGTFGLYLDADFYHGRTQHCDTFDNEPLTVTEDFTISGVEAFGFSMTF